MKKIIIIIAVVVVAGIGVYYAVLNYGSRGTPNVSAPSAQSPTVPTPTVPAPNTPTTPTSSSMTIHIKNFSFNPPTLTVKKGTKVMWVNDDSTAHTVTSDLGSLLGSGTLSPGQSFSFIFTNPGSVNYHCNIHPMMKGTVIVEN